MNKKIIATSLSLLAAGALIITPLAQAANELDCNSASDIGDTEETIINVIVGDNLTISTKGNVDINATPNVLAEGIDEVTVKTNGANGYQLAIEMKDATNGQKLVGATSGNTDEILPGTGTFAAPAELSIVSDKGQWGFATRGSETSLEKVFSTSPKEFAAVPAAGDNVIIKNTDGTNDTSNNTTEVTYGVLIDFISNDTYSNTVLYTAIAN